MKFQGLQGAHKIAMNIGDPALELQGEQKCARRK